MSCTGIREAQQLSPWVSSCRLVDYKFVDLLIECVIYNWNEFGYAVAPVCYAHLAASQVAQFMKFDEFSETSSSHGGVTSVGSVSIPQLPRLHPNVSSSMFFC